MIDLIENIEQTDTDTHFTVNEVPYWFSTDHPAFCPFCKDAKSIWKRLRPNQPIVKTEENRIKETFRLIERIGDLCKFEVGGTFYAYFPQCAVRGCELCQQAQDMWALYGPDEEIVDPINTIRQGENYIFFKIGDVTYNAYTTCMCEICRETLRIWQTYRPDESPFLAEQSSGVDTTDETYTCDCGEPVTECICVDPLVSQMQEQIDTLRKSVEEMTQKNEMLTQGVEYWQRVFDKDSVRLRDMAAKNLELINEVASLNEALNERNALIARAALDMWKDAQ